MSNPGRRPTPVDVAALEEHIARYGLHLHRTTNPPFRWGLIVGYACYIPCAPEICLKKHLESCAVANDDVSPPRAAWLAMLDRRDFEEWMGRLRVNPGWLAMPKNAIVRGRHLETLLRQAWEAGAASTPHTAKEA